MAAWLAAAVAGGLAAGQDGTADAAARGPAGRFVREDSVGARTADPLLARIWTSGFFRKNEAVLREILNNDYGFFEPGDPVPPAGSKGWGCFFRRPGGRDAILLKKDLFAHVVVSIEETLVRSDTGTTASAVLVHELCHDFWTNILDESERSAFSREGEAFLRDFQRAQSDDEIRRFLALAGEDPADVRCLRSYAGIAAIVKAHPTRALCGHEMFAWLAERSFTKLGLIPCPLRKYYASILAGVPTGIAD